MTNKNTAEHWHRIGLQVGRERGQIDKALRQVQKVEDLWVPDGVNPAYIEGLHAGYLDAVAGAPITLGI